MAGMTEIPVVDVGSLVGLAGPPAEDVARDIEGACRSTGFFYVGGHGVPAELIERLDRASRAFFDRPEAEKLEIAMERGGRAWRGYFPVGAELTSGRPDQKEGLYFGEELAADHPLVRAGTPMHGPNLFPQAPAGFRECVLDYMAALTHLGHRLMAGIALSL